MEVLDKAKWHFEETFPASMREIL